MQWLSEDYGLLAAWEGAAAQESQSLQEETVVDEKLHYEKKHCWVLPDRQEKVEEVAAGPADLTDSAAGLPDLVVVAFDLVVQANYSAVDLTRCAVVELETVVVVAGEGGGNDDWGLHTVHGEQEEEDLCVLG